MVEAKVMRIETNDDLLKLAMAFSKMNNRLQILFWIDQKESPVTPEVWIQHWWDRGGKPEFREGAFIVWVLEGAGNAFSGKSKDVELIIEGKYLCECGKNLTVRFISTTVASVARVFEDLLEIYGLSKKQIFSEAA